MPANNGNVKHEAGCLYARIAEKRNSRKPTPLSGKVKQREEIELALMEGEIYRPIRLSRRLPHRSTKQVPLVSILGAKRGTSPLFIGIPRRCVLYPLYERHNALPPEKTRTAKEVSNHVREQRAPLTRPKRATRPRLRGGPHSLVQPRTLERPGPN